MLLQAGAPLARFAHPLSLHTLPWMGLAGKAGSHCTHPVFGGLPKNYTCRHQNEIQSQYFDMGKVSLHVTILYRPVSPLDGVEGEGGADVPVDEGGNNVSVDDGGADVPVDEGRANISVSVGEAPGSHSTDEDAQVVGDSGWCKGYA